MPSKPEQERICLACRAKPRTGCRKHGNPVHGMTEAETALQIAKLGFTIVAPGDRKPMTIGKLEKMVKAQKIDARGYVTEGV